MEACKAMRNGIHTLRGQLTFPMAAPLRSQLFNGSFTKNFKVKEVHIFPTSTINNDAMLIMHFDDVVKVLADADDNAQFGWATMDYGGGPSQAYVDPDHIIVNDLFCSVLAANPGTINYVIKLERISTTLPQSILDEVKNRQQS
jgi:hypothetical protein